MSLGVNSYSVSHNCFSPSDLLDLELTVINEAVNELQHAMNETPQDPNASLITLIMPVLARQTEVLRDRNPSNKPIEAFWADRTLSVEERAFFFRHKKVFFDRIILSREQDVEVLSVVRAAMQIGDSLDDLEQVVDICHSFKQHLGKLPGRYERRLNAIAATIEVCAKLKEESPAFYKRVLHFVKMAVSEGAGGVSEENLIKLIEAVRGAVIRGDIEECMLQAAPLMEPFNLVEHKIYLLSRVLCIEEANNREHMCREMLSLIELTKGAGEIGGFFAPLSAINNLEDRTQACLLARQFIERYPYLQKNGLCCFYVIRSILEMKGGIEEGLLLVSPIIEEMVGRERDATYLFGELTGIQDRERRRVICTEIASVIPEMNDVSDIFRMVQEVVACKDAAQRQAIYQSYK